jgi:hypothetical protein
VAKRSAPRHARRRKRRGTGSPAGTATASAPAGAAGAGPSASSVGASAAGKRTQARGSAGARREAARGASRFGDALTVGERPQPPWHPLPVSEILIFAGMIGIVIGVSRKQSGLPVILAGVGSVVVGTLDFTIREHLSGYRSHASLLAAVPIALLHSGVAVGMLALGAPSPSWVVAPLLLDVPVFLFVFRRLRARFREARHERVLAAGR